MLVEGRLLGLLKRVMADAAAGTVDALTAGLQEKLGTSWRAFAEWSGSWMNVKRHVGEDALAATYQEVLSGALDPRDGHVLTLWKD